MNVLSVFNGFSGARVALEKAGLHCDKYFSSEIDKYANQITHKNYPDTIDLGDVTKWRDWDWVLPEIDLLIGGSPCQGFSLAGKQLNFEDPRSKLFFEFVDILNYYKPKYFLLENVKMKKEYQDVISDLLGVEPIEINSNLVSAQNRKRLYWTNIQGVSQPEDKGILLKDILEYGFVDGKKSYCIDASYYKGGNLKQYFEKHRRQLVFDNEHSGCIEVGKAAVNGHDFLKRVYSPCGKSPTLTAVCGGNQERKIAVDSKHWRKLTPIECERLQTLPDNYTEGVSNTQRYKMLGNGFTVDVIAHILKGAKQ